MSKEERKKEIQNEIDKINNKIKELEEKRAELNNELIKLNGEEPITAEDLFFFKPQKFGR